MRESKQKCQESYKHVRQKNKARDMLGKALKYARKQDKVRDILGTAMNMLENKVKQ